MRDKTNANDCSCSTRSDHVSKHTAYLIFLATFGLCGIVAFATAAVGAFIGDKAVMVAGLVCAGLSVLATLLFTMVYCLSER